jgi:biopolymer transport protein ExbD
MTDLSLTPLVDTALTLLVIFMIAAPMMHNNIKVVLPKTTNSDGKQKEEIVVFIDKDNKLTFNGKAMLTDDLIKEILKQKPNAQKLVSIKGDRSASYGVVLELFDQLRKQGVTHVVLPTTKI